MSLSLDIRLARGDFALEVAFEGDAGVTALFGHSGAGKTTVLDAIAGLAQPEAGRIEAGGRVLFDKAARISLPPHKRRVGYVFQDARLFPHLNVQQNLRFGGRSGDEARTIEMLGLGPLLTRRPATLSGGERRRVAIGRALLSAPEVLLLDEPLSGIDAARKGEILPYLERLRDELRLPIVLVSHIAEEVARLAHTVLVIEQGRVAAQGRPEEILADPARAGLLGAGEAGAILAGTVRRYVDGLTEVETPAGAILVPGMLEIGQDVRLRVLARDVMVATEPPQGLSALNVLAGRIEAIGTSETADISIRCGETVLLARITGHSAARLGLTVGMPVHAVLKSVTLGGAQVFG